MEEVASDLLDPVLQRATGVDKNAKVDWSALPRTFAVGGATGVVMGGGSRALNAAKAGGFNNLNAAENAQELNERLSDNNVRQAKGKSLTYTQEDIFRTANNLSQSLQKMTKEKRAEFLKANPRIARYFNESGTVKQFTARNNHAQNSGNFATKNKNLAEVEARYSIQKIDGKDTVVVDTDQDIFEGAEETDYPKIVRQYMLNKFKNQVLPIGDSKAYVNRDQIREYTYPANRRMDGDLKTAKMRAGTELDNLLKTAEYVKHEDDDGRHPEAVRGWDKYKTKFIVNGRMFEGEVSLDLMERGNLFYDLGKIKDITPGTNGSKLPASRQSDVVEENPSSTNSIRQENENVNSFSKKSTENVSKGENHDKDAYSASLQGRESELAYAPASTANDNARQTMQTMTLLTDGRVEIVLTSEDILTADGQKANGAYIDGVLYLNANASSYEKAMFVASHEMVHTLEGTKAYEALGKFIEERIKGDERLSKRYNVVNYVIAYANAQSKEYSAETKLYEATTEMYADFVANEVLSNEATVRRLVNRNRNVVVRMLTWVRSAVKRLGMSKSERETYDTLRKMEKLLANALEEGNGGISLDEVEERLQSSEKETAEGSTARYSIQSVDGQDIVVIDTDQDIFDGKEKSEYPKIVRKYMLAKFRGKVLPVGNSKTYVNKDGLEEYAFPANRRMDKDIKAAKMKAGTELDNLLKTANYLGWEQDDGRHPEAVRGWDKYETQFIVDNERFQAEISIELLERGDLFYDMSKIKNITLGTSGRALLGQSTSRQSDVVEGDPSTISIRENSEKSTQNAKKVEKNFSGRASLEVDSEGNSLTKAQAEYFKDSKVRDKNSNLLVVYHGSPSKFTEFSHRFMNTNGNAHGRGFYFTEDLDYAAGYRKEGGQLLKGYLDVKRPASETEITMRKVELIKLIKATCEAQAQEFVDEESYNNMDDALLDTWVSNYVNTYEAYNMDSVYKQVAESIFNNCDNDVDIFAELTNAGAGTARVLSLARKSIGYDGIIFDNGNGTHQFISFESNQFKNATNTDPTSNPDIRYSVDMTFSEQVDAFLSGADTSQTHLKLLDETPELLKEAGFPNLPVLMTAKHLKTIISNDGKERANYHGLSADIVKKLPEYISDPVMLADSLTRGDSLVVITEAIDSENRPIVAAILLEGKGRIDGKHINANIMTSAYGKDNFQAFLNKIADKNAVLYWNKKKSQDLSVSLGIQFPNAVTSLNSNTIIRKANAFVNSLSKNSLKNTNPRYSIDIDNFNPLLYNEIQLSTQERNYLYSEALTWDADKRNIPLRRTLSNEYTYLYIIDDNGEIHVYEKEKAVNIHERGDEYDQQNREQPNTAVEGVRAEQAKHDRSNSTLQNGRSPSTTNRRDNRSVRSEGERDGRRYRQDGFYADRNQERKRIVYFDAESNKRYSLDTFEYMTDEEYEVTLAETELTDDGSVASIQRVTERKAKLTKEQLIQNVKARVADSKLRIQMETTNVQAGIEKAAKRLGEDVEAKIQKARSAPSAALNMITNEQRDYSGKKKVGKSLTEIFTPIQEKSDEYYGDFCEYLLQHHNVDRMSLETKAKEEMRRLVANDTELSSIVKRKNVDEAWRRRELLKTENGKRY